MLGLIHEMYFNFRPASRDYTVGLLMPHRNESNKLNKSNKLRSILPPHEQCARSNGSNNSRPGHHR